MVAEGTTAVFITFLLAMIGYGGLTVVVVLTSLGREIPRRFWWVVTAIIVAHVSMIWAVRYEWDFALAVRNGYPGFVLFHLAFLMILASAFLQERIARILIRTAFVIVTLGAAGATFLYDAVAIYRIPVLLCGAAGIGSLVWYFVMRGRRATQTA